MSLHHCVEPRPGESAPFHLESRWRLHAPPQRVWDVFNRVDLWPTWWPGISDCALDASGTRAQVHVRSPIGHGLAVGIALREAHPSHSALIDVTGDLRGTGTWSARTVGRETRVDFVWCVVTTSRPARILRPLGVAAHQRVMAEGEAGLNTLLAAREGAAQRGHSAP